jgi:hypothetical protein
MTNSFELAPSAATRCCALALHVLAACAVCLLALRLSALPLLLLLPVVAASIAYDWRAFAPCAMRIVVDVHVLRITRAGGTRQFRIVACWLARRWIVLVLHAVGGRGISLREHLLVHRAQLDAHAYAALRRALRTHAAFSPHGR